MGFIVMMMIAFLLAAAAVSVLGLFAIHEGHSLALFHEEVHPSQRS